MPETTWHDLAVETALVIHVEQIIGGAAKDCDVEGCSEEADLLVTSEPDMEPGFVCRTHGLMWIGATLDLLRKMSPS